MQSLTTEGYRRGVEQRQLVGLITQRSEVRILPPLPTATTGKGPSYEGPFYVSSTSGYLPHNSSEAMRAPSDMAWNLAQHTLAWPTREPMPQSVPAMTFSLPTMLA